MGEPDEESLVPRVFPHHQELPSRALQTGVGGNQKQVRTVNTALSSSGSHPLVSVSSSVGVQPEMKFCSLRYLSGPATDSFNQAARFVAG